MYNKFLIDTKAKCCHGIAIKKGYMANESFKISKTPNSFFN